MTGINAMEQAIVCAYRLPDGACIEAVEQRDGSHLWAVRIGRQCLGKDGGWEWEPQPSSRDDDFFARCRWPTAEEAYTGWTQAQPHGQTVLRGIPSTG